MRLVVGLMFACHGAQKLLGMFGGKGGAQGLMMFGGIIELVGGFLIALGLLTRPAAFLSSGMMAVAYFMAHASERSSCRSSTRASWPSCIALSFSTSFSAAAAHGVSMHSSSERKTAVDEVGGPARVGRSL